ncbi:DUF202 domain-containing protein [uncultured Microbacterium sp.]|uniref:DUF202 domain-containing protein n=1 Tax=uncultured Microbacterium sp. TaxID=191216 RepID=UPI0025F61607|nr:DUF202 domain-containing protein [uncultured Microbacterium sp.]
MTLFDPGLQPERTQLAWRRTCLALAAGSLAAMRLLPHAFGSAWWILGGIAGLIATGALWIGSGRRMGAANDALRAEDEQARMPGGMLLAAVAGFVALVGVVSLGIVLASGLGAPAAPLF